MPLTHEYKSMMVPKNVTPLLDEEIIRLITGNYVKYWNNFSAEQLTHYVGVAEGHNPNNMKQKVVREFLIMLLTEIIKDKDDGWC